MSRAGRIALSLAALVALAASFGLGRRYPISSAKAGNGRRIRFYVDPMHPAYKSDKPGIAPDCGMALEPVYGESGGREGPAAEASAPGSVTVDAATRQSIRLRILTVASRGSTRVLRLVGRVVPDEGRTYKINVGVDGFIRQTFNDSVGTKVSKQSKLAAFYAPEFIAAASGFLAASERIPGSVSKEGLRSIQNYADRLRNLGMSDMQMNEIAKTRQVPDTIDVLAPADGFILARNITAGQHFDRGMEFYRIADLSQVWILTDVDVQDASRLRAGSSAKILLAGERSSITARITEDILPANAGGKLKVRLVAENPGFLLRPEMLVDVELQEHLPPALTAPQDAVVDSGTHARVYVERADGTFEPREVETGWRFGDDVEIRRGLREGERIVASATFLIDSESRLSALSSGPGGQQSTSGSPGGSQIGTAQRTTDPSCGMPIDRSVAIRSGNTVTYRGSTYYFCSSDCKHRFEHRNGFTIGERPSHEETKGNAKG